MEHLAWTARGSTDKRSPRFAAAGEVSFTPLQTALPSIGLTKRRLKHLEAIHLVREQRDTGAQDLAFNARPFILRGIPLRRPRSDQLAFTRRNGRFLLEITAHPRFGLPYGQDRLIPIWVARIQEGIKQFT